MISKPQSKALAQPSLKSIMLVITSIDSFFVSRHNEYRKHFQKTRQIIKAPGVTEILLNIVHCITLDFGLNLDCQINSIYLLNAFLTVSVCCYEFTPSVKIYISSLIKTKIMFSFNHSEAPLFFT